MGHRGGTLVLSADNDQGAGNQFIGAITVNQGVLNVRHDRALGTAASATTISNFAALEVQGDLTIAEATVVVAGSGLANQGALRNVGGNNTLAGITQLNSNPIWQRVDRRQRTSKQGRSGMIWVS